MLVAAGDAEGQLIGDVAFDVDIDALGIAAAFARDRRTVARKAIGPNRQRHRQLGACIRAQRIINHVGADRRAILVEDQIAGVRPDRIGGRIAQTQFVGFAKILPAKGDRHRAGEADLPGIAEVRVDQRFALFQLAQVEFGRRFDAQRRVHRAVHRIFERRLAVAARNIVVQAEAERPLIPHGAGNIVDLAEEDRREAARIDAAPILHQRVGTVGYLRIVARHIFIVVGGIDVAAGRAGLDPGQRVVEIGEIVAEDAVEAEAVAFDVGARRVHRLAIVEAFLLEAVAIIAEEIDFALAQVEAAIDEEAVGFQFGIAVALRQRRHADVGLLHAQQRRARASHAAAGLARIHIFAADVDEAAVAQLEAAIERDLIILAVAAIILAVAGIA